MAGTADKTKTVPMTWPSSCARPRKWRLTWTPGLPKRPKGKWPIVGGYWKPIGYAIYLSTFGYLAWFAFLQKELWISVLMAVIVLFYLHLAWADIRAFLQTKTNRSDQLKGPRSTMPD